MSYGSKWLVPTKEEKQRKKNVILKMTFIVWHLQPLQIFI